MPTLVLVCVCVCVCMCVHVVPIVGKIEDIQL